MAELNLSRRKRKKIESKSSILKVARMYFQNKGFENTSIEDIAEGADISKSTFFNYFPSKESLLYEIAKEEVCKIELFIREELDEKLSAKEKIYLTMNLMVEDTGPFLRLTKSVMQAISIMSDEEASPVINMERILASLIEEGQEKGEFTKDYNPNDIAAVIQGAYFAAFFRWILKKEMFSKEDKLEFNSFLEIISNGVFINVNNMGNIN